MRGCEHTGLQQRHKSIITYSFSVRLYFYSRCLCFKNRKPNCRKDKMDKTDLQQRKRNSFNCSTTHSNIGLRVLSRQHNLSGVKGLEDERWCWCGTCFRSFQRLWNPELQWLRHWAYCRGNRAAFEKGTDSLLNAGMATGCTLLCNGPWSSERPGKTLHSLHTLAFQQERTKQKHLTYICILMLY